MQIGRGREEPTGAKISGRRGRSRASDRVGGAAVGDLPDHRPRRRLRNLRHARGPQGDRRRGRRGQRLTQPRRLGLQRGHPACPCRMLAREMSRRARRRRSPIALRQQARRRPVFDPISGGPSARLPSRAARGSKAWQRSNHRAAGRFATDLRSAKPGRSGTKVGPKSSPH